MRSAGMFVAFLMCFLAAPGCTNAPELRVDLERSPAAFRTASSAADRLLRETMRAHDLPSISVAISMDGELVYERALGYSDIASEHPATSQTVYAQGSTTKSLTAVAALMLSEQGRLDLDAPVQKYCPAFPEKPQPISVRQLLAHTAGIRHYDYRRFADDYLNSIRYPNVAASLAKFSGDPLVAPPGERYHYSSWGYVVVACAIEGAGGADFPRFVKEEILAPAGMANSRMDEPGRMLKSRASGYSLQDDGSFKLTGVQDPSDRHGASGLLSTPEDMVKFADALMAGRFLETATINEMWSSQPLSGGGDSGHGLGWELLSSGEVGKGGTAYDATSFLYVLPSERLAVAVATNRVLWTTGREELARDLAGLFRADANSDSE